MSESQTNKWFWPINLKKMLYSSIKNKRVLLRPSRFFPVVMVPDAAPDAASDLLRMCAGDPFIMQRTSRLRGRPAA